MRNTARIVAVAAVAVGAAALVIAPASATGTYTQVVNSYTGGCMGTYNNSTSPGALIMQYGCTSSNEEKWALGVTSSGEVVNYGTNMCLTPYGNSTSPGAYLVQATCLGQNNQGWYFKGDGGEIINAVNGLCVTADGVGSQVHISQDVCQDLSGSTQDWYKQ